MVEAPLEGRSTPCGWIYPLRMVKARVHRAVRRTRKIHRKAGAPLGVGKPPLPSRSEHEDSSVRDDRRRVRRAEICAGARSDRAEARWPLPLSPNAEARSRGDSRAAGSRKKPKLDAPPEPEIPRHCGMAELRLRDVMPEDAQTLVSEAIARGYSTKTALHIRNCVSAIFTHAERQGWFTGRNPARFVKLPEMTRTRLPVALSFDQLKALPSMLRPLARAMVLCASPPA